MSVTQGTILQALEDMTANVYHQLSQECGGKEVGEMLEKISQDELNHVRIAETLFALAEDLIGKNETDHKTGEV